MTRHTNSLTLLAATLVLAGCAVGPDYKRPATPTLPADFASVTPVAPGSTPTTIASDWWKIYNDPLLNDLVGASISNNPNIRLAIARVDEARGALREANSAFFPEVDYSGYGVRARTGVAGGSAGGSSVSGTGQVFYGKVFNAQAAVSYELDLWGKLRRQSESASASLLSSSYARDVVTLSLASTTAQSYFTLRSLDAQIKVTENTLQVVGESLDIAQKRLNAGYTSALDFAQADSLRAQTQVQLRELRRQRAVQEHQLGNLTSNLSLRIAPGAIDQLPVPVSPPPGLPSTLLERRPDVARDEQSVRASNAEIGIAKAALFPTFSLTGGYGGQSFDLSDLVKAPFRFWNIGLGISGPIVAGGKYVARLDQARSRNDEQIATYQTTVEGAFNEVADALTNVSESNAAESEVMTQIWKYIGVTGDKAFRSVDQSYAHWIVYRYADVLLMKAEAMAYVNRGSESLAIIQTIRTRANALFATQENPSPSDANAVAQYVIDERDREFAFEGKRWFDLLRFAKRNNYANLNVLIAASTLNIPGNLQQSASTKLKDINSLYLPIPNTEILADPNLVQNPFYQ